MRRPIDLAQGFLNPARIHGNRACLLVVVSKVPGERLDIAVEDDSDHFAFPIDGGRAGIASDDVGGGNEVQRCLQVDL